MENPVRDIRVIVDLLNKAPPSVQRDVIESYFTSTASMTSPLCRTGSFNGSRWFLIQLYRWYKIVNPQVHININSVSFDAPNMLLYLSIHKSSKMTIMPFCKVEASSVSVFKLTRDPTPFPQCKSEQTVQQSGEDNGGESNSSSKTSKAVAAKTKDHNGQSGQTAVKKYYIQSQNDLYQSSEWMRLVLPYGIGAIFPMTWRFLVTILCVVGAVLGRPITWLQENVFGGNMERVQRDEVRGED